MLYAMKMPRLAYARDGAQKDFSYMAWSYFAEHSHMVADPDLNELQQMVWSRFLELEEQAIWAQARLVMEVFLRTPEAANRMAMSGLLLAIRVRTAHQLRHSADAYVAAVERLLDAETWPTEAAFVLENLVDWAEKVARVPDAHRRERVAHQSRLLHARLPGEQQSKLEQTLAQLHQDVRIAVRQAAAAENTRDAE